MAKRIIFICVGLLVAWMLISWIRPRLDAPTWDVIVTDSRGTPVSDLPVTETWQNYSCEHEEHTSTVLTDSHGAVHFPRIYARHNPLRCVTETASEGFDLVHGSFGPHARVDVAGVICVTNDKGYCIDWTGSPRSIATHVLLKQP